MTNPSDPNPIYAALQREVSNVKDQIDSVRRIANQIIQKVTRHEELLTSLKTDQDNMEEKQNENRDERIQQFHDLESSLSVLTARKDIVPGISVSTLLTILAMAGSGVTGYVMLQSNVAVNQKTITELEDRLGKLKEEATKNHDIVLATSKEYTDNMLRINALQTANDGTSLKGAVSTLEVSVQLLQQSANQQTKEFTQAVTESVDDLKGMEKRVNAALSTIEGIQTQITDLAKKRR
jgi:hypothetical protein